MHKYFWNPCDKGALLSNKAAYVTRTKSFIRDNTKTLPLENGALRQAYFKGSKLVSFRLKVRARAWGTRTLGALRLQTGVMAALIILFLFSRKGQIGQGYFVESSFLSHCGFTAVFWMSIMLCSFLFLFLLFLARAPYWFTPALHITIIRERFSLLADLPQCYISDLVKWVWPAIVYMWYLANLQSFCQGSAQF